MKLSWKGVRYSSLFSLSDEDLSSDVDGSEKESFLKSGLLHRRHLDSNRCIKIVIWATILNCLLFATSLALFLSWYIPTTELNAGLRKWIYYSPLLDMVDVGKHTVTINGTLFDPTQQAWSRRGPDPEADAIWDEIELIRTMPITAEQVRKLGKDPERVAKFNDDYWHLGDDAYMAQFDVFHQIHCVNTLRKVAYPEYYHPTWNHDNGFTTHSEIWKLHINHCVDILVQALTCSGNLNMYTMEWRDQQDYPFPNFSINRECVDFEKLIEFRKEVTVDFDMWLNQTRPVDANILPMPSDYYRLYNVTKDPKFDGIDDGGV